MESGKDKEAKLRVVEEETRAEEVVRLQEDGDVEQISRIVVSRPSDTPTLLESEIDEEAERRSHEPDIDAIIEETNEDGGLEDVWRGDEQRTPAPIGWFVLIFLGIAMVGFVIYRLHTSSAAGGVLEQARQQSVEHLETIDEEEQEMVDLMDSLESLVRSYLKESSAEGLLAWVRYPERVEVLMQNHYRESFEQRGEFFRMLGIESITINDRSFFTAQFELADGTMDSLLVEQLNDGSLKVDWEHDVKFQPMAWADFVTTKPVGEWRFRVAVVPDYAGLFSHEFADEKKWAGFRLTFGDNSDFLVGYVERGSELAEEIQGVIEMATVYPVPMYLELKMPDDLESPRGVLIEKVISPRWVYMGEPEE